MVFACAVLAYLSLFGKTMAFQNLESVMLTSLVYALLSWVGARSFKTYSGIQRFTKGAAYAFKARIAIWNGDYATAADAAKK